MLFCPKCGSLLKSKAEKTKRVLFCSCGFTDKNPKNVEMKEIVSQKDKEVEVISEDIDPNPVVEADCPKCHHTEASYWMQQMRGGDEPETKFFKCKKCKNVWRDQS
ncbi:MAG: transcription factor S [archaeon]